MKSKSTNGIANNPYQGKFVRFTNKESLKWQLLKKDSDVSSNQGSGCNGINSLIGVEWDGEIFVNPSPSTIPYSGGVVTVIYGGTVAYIYSNGYTKKEDLTLTKIVPISGRTDSGDIKYMNQPLFGSFEGELGSGMINWDGVTQLGAGRPSFTIDMQDSYADKDEIKLNTIRENLEESDITWTATATSTIEGNFDYIITSDYCLALQKHFIGWVELTANAEDCTEQSKVIYINCKEHLIDPDSYTYDIINVTNPTIQWNSVSATVKYTEIAYFKYYDGGTGSQSEVKTIDSVEYFGSEFSANTTDIPVYYTGITESYMGIQRSWTITQLRNEYGVRSTTYLLSIKDNGREVEWNDTNEYIDYTVTTIVEYYNGQIAETTKNMVKEMTYSKNFGLSPINHEMDIRYPETGDNYAQDTAIIIQKAGAKDIKSTSYRILDVADKYYTEWDATATSVPFTAATINILNDDSIVSSTTTSSWYYTFDENLSTKEELRKSTIKFPKDAEVGYASQGCTIYQYGAWQKIPDTDTYAVKVLNSPTIEWNISSQPIKLNLIQTWRCHNNKTSSVTTSSEEVVSGWANNTTEESIELTGTTNVDWHGEHDNWLITQLPGKVLEDTIYQITYVLDSITDTSIYAEYNDTFYNVPFSGSITYLYKDSAQDYTDNVAEVWRTTFDKNNTDAVIERKDTILWNGKTAECTIKQHGAYEPSGNYAYKIVAITPNSSADTVVKYNAATVTVTYTGNTYVIYRNGEVATSAKTSDVKSEQGNTTPENTSAQIEARTGSVTWNGDTAQWICGISGGTTIIDTTYKIQNVLPRIGKVTPEPYLDYNASAAYVNFTGETYYHHLDGSIASSTTEQTRIFVIEGNTGETQDTRSGAITDFHGVTENNEWSEYIHGAWEFITGDGAAHLCFIENLQDVNATWQDTSAVLSFDYVTSGKCYNGQYREQSREVNVNTVSVNFPKNDTDTAIPLSGTFDYGECLNTPWKGTQGYNSDKKVTSAVCTAEQNNLDTTKELPKVEWDVTAYTVPCDAVVTYTFESGRVSAVTVDENTGLTYTFDTTLDVNTSTASTTYSKTKKDACDISTTITDIKKYASDYTPDVTWTVYQYGEWEFLPDDELDAKYSIDKLQDVTAQCSDTSAYLDFYYTISGKCHNGQYRVSSSTHVTKDEHAKAEFTANETDTDRPISGTFTYDKCLNTPWNGIQYHDSSARVVGATGTSEQVGLDEINQTPICNWNNTTIDIQFTRKINYTYEDGNTGETTYDNASLTITGITNNTGNTCIEITETAQTANAWDMTSVSSKISDYTTVTPSDKKPDFTAKYFQHGEYEINPTIAPYYKVKAEEHKYSASYDSTTCNLTYVRQYYYTTYGGHEVQNTAKTPDETVTTSVTYDSNSGNYQVVDRSGIYIDTGALEGFRNVPWTVTLGYDPSVYVTSVTYNVVSASKPTVAATATTANVSYSGSATVNFEDGTNTVVLCENYNSLSGSATVSVTPTSKDEGDVYSGTASAISTTFIYNNWHNTITSSEWGYEVAQSGYDIVYYLSNGTKFKTGGTIVTSALTQSAKNSGTVVSVNLGPAVTSIAEKGLSGLTSLSAVTNDSGNLQTIGASALTNNTQLVSFPISNNIKSIGTSAFAGCTKLTTLNSTNTLPDNSGYTTVTASAFKGCTSLSSITIPSGVTTISQTAFSGDTNLYTINLTDGLKTIGNSAFTNCFSSSRSKNGNLTLPNTVTSVGEYGFANCTYMSGLTISTAMSEISKACFINCQSNREINIPNNIETINDSAFTSNRYAQIILPSDGLTTIGNYAFADCWSSNPSITLSGVTLPDSVTSIGIYCFSNCYYLPKTVMSKNVETIAEGAFINCSSMREVDLQYETNTVLTIIDKYAYKNCISLTGITFPDSTEELHRQAFYSACTMSSINITKNISVIGSGSTCGTYLQVFSYCYGLNTVTVDTANTTYHSQDNCCIYTNGNSSHPAGCICFGGNHPTIPTTASTIHIGQYAFEGNIRENSNCITAITIPDEVTRIDGNAFYNCAKLSSLTLNENLVFIGEYAFANCKIKQLETPSTLIDIDNHAFENNEMTSMTLNENLKTIGDSAFKSNNMTSIIIPDSVETIGSEAFRDCVYTNSIILSGGSITSIGEKAFSYTDATSITVVSTSHIHADNNCCMSGSTVIFGCNGASIPSTATSIGNYAFQGNLSGNTVLTLSEGLTKIGDGAFRDATGLISINLNISTLTSIGTSNGYTFYNTRLQSVEIGNSGSTTTHLYCYGDYNFASNSAITSVTINKNVNQIGTNGFASCTNIENLIYGDGCTSTVRAYAISAKNVTIPNTVSAITSYAFLSYTKLSAVTLPDSIKQINNGAFESCTKISAVTIPSSVTAIITYAFAYCSSLSTVTCLPETPPDLGTDVFYSNASGRKIFVPSDSLISYKAATNWSSYKDYIDSIP